MDSPMPPDITLNPIPLCLVLTGGVMKKLLLAGVVVTTFGVTQAIAAACIFVANNNPWLLLLLLIPAAVGGIAWITFQVFKNLPNALSKISALLAWAGFSVACLGGGGSYFLNTPYTIQLVSWGSFAWIAGVYVTLTWANLWKQKRVGAAPAQSVPASADPAQPQSDSAQEPPCRELLVVERWLRVISEHGHDSSESYGNQAESEQISCSIRDAADEGQNLVSSRRDVVLSMRSQSQNRRRTQSLSPPRNHHRLDRHPHQRMRCMRPVPS